MISLPRARLSLVAAVGLASAVLVLELPIGELLHQRSELSAVSSELARLRSTNDALSADVASLHQSSTIAAMAHGQYGLVGPGQRAYVLSPVASSTGGVVPDLTQRNLPRLDLVVPSASSLGSVTSSTARAGGSSAVGSLWSRALARLEFWRWAF